MIRFFLIAALAAGTLAAPVSALAPASARAVSYADLDLSNPRDVARLHRRIAAALESVCGSYATAESWAAPEIDRCRAEARTRADRQLAALLTGTVRVADARGAAPR